jgi:threonine/homoserine/homoserine lactone efflux protein
MPGFFVFSKIGLLDLTIISATSFSVPFIGNIFMILFLDRVRFFLSSQKALRFTNILSGFILIIVAILIQIY